VQLKNAIKANKVANKSMNIVDEVKEDQETLAYFKVKLKRIEKKMLDIVKSTKELKINYDKITKVIGVGPVIGISCIIETRNFTRFYNPRKFGCHCGLAPFPYSSGSSVRGKTRTSNLCNKTLKGFLFKGAWTAIQHDPQLKTYYNRKILEGKNKFGVANAVAFKLVLRIFAVVKRDEPFVKLVAKKQFLSFEVKPFTLYRSYKRKQALLRSNLSGIVWILDEKVKGD
jgi:transposase